MAEYKYRAINDKGRAHRGVLRAQNERDLYEQVRANGMELVDCKIIKENKATAIFGKKKVKTRDLIGLFTHLQQLQGAGVPLLDSLVDARDSSDAGAMRDMVGDVLRDVSEGTALSGAFAKFPDTFPTLFIAMIKAGENTGDMVEAFNQLIKYLKWYDELQAKVKKATKYPMVLGSVIMVVMVVMMGFVVPQIVEFIKKMDQVLPWYTVALIVTSEIFKKYWYVIGGTPIILIIIHKIIYRYSPGYALKSDKLALNLPVFGDIGRKINIARYTRTFGVLFSGGIDIINCLRYSQSTVTNKQLHLALDKVEQEVYAGKPLSVAFNETGEFPSLVVRMVKIGEESGNLKPVLDQVTDFYSKDVDEAINGLIAMIEPALTSIMGLLILWIAAGVFGPIYNSFATLDF